ncbi:MAG: radical SAM protein [Bacteroidales bacterium]|nr:radical SAM protein [Bacteroidales bacterium]
MLNQPKSSNDEASFIGVNRHRIGVDGEGVTTLAAFHGCPLRCCYCLNPSCLDADARVRRFTPETLYQELLIDDLYFVATGGGVCFGGGEPLLRPEFIRQFHTLCAGRWKITLETSLNVALPALQTVAPLVNDFIIDIKDANDEIYAAYTGKSNAQVWENLAWLAANYDHEHVFLRVPLIPEFNTDEDRERSVERLSKLGFEKFDRFSYRVTR